MQPCFKCPEWAQWRVRKPTYDSEGKITGWENIAALCGSHKLAQEALPENKGLKFDFMGAAPVWH